MIARPKIIQLFATRNKCWMCKHRFAKPIILPVDKLETGKFQPNYNAEVFFHLFDTHGIPDDIARDWVFGSIYGLELTPFGYRE